MRRQSAIFALLLCSGLLLALVGPRPARLLAPDSPAPSAASAVDMAAGSRWRAGLAASAVAPVPAGGHRWPGASAPSAVGPAGRWPGASALLEVALAVDLTVRSAVAPVPVDRFRWPLDGVPPVVRRFDPPAERWLAGHRGVDLAAAPGAAVRAAGPGRVRFAGPIGGRSVVSVDHAGGLRTTYEPVSPSVKSGDVVDAGDPIGRLSGGHAGCPVAACLHWGLRQGEVYLDPLALLGLGQVRLLPLRELI